MEDAGFMAQKVLTSVDWILEGLAGVTREGKSGYGELRARQ
jgi:hypothetical protein